MRKLIDWPELWEDTQARLAASPVTKIQRRPPRSPPPSTSALSHEPIDIDIRRCQRKQLDNQKRQRETRARIVRNAPMHLRSTRTHVQFMQERENIESENWSKFNHRDHEQWKKNGLKLLMERVQEQGMEHGLGHGQERHYEKDDEKQENTRNGFKNKKNYEYTTQTTTGTTRGSTVT